MGMARLAAIVPVLVGLAGLSFVALRAGSADAIVYDASQEMAAWTASHAQPGMQTWQWVHDDLARAEARTPYNPTVAELLGSLEARRTDRREYLDAALVHFRKALELRPTSPYAWADIAELEYRRGDTGKIFEATLNRSAMLGPAEPEVQQTVASLGLAVWDEVGPKTRSAIEQVVASGMRRNPPEMLQIAERRGRLAVACRHLPDLAHTIDSKWSQICQSTEATQ